MTTTTETWREAGTAWGHAPVDWAYRFESHTRDAVEHVFGLLRIGDGRSLLDVACGAGYALGRAHRLGASVAGIDASAELIEIARRRAPAGDVVAGSMFELPWGDESFDVVTSFNGIWGGCGEAVAEAYRVLRPGGRLAITFWGPGAALDLRDYLIVVGSTAPGIAAEFKGLASIGAPGVAESLVEEAGFDVVERGHTTAVLEAVNGDDLWAALRSAGAAVPSLEHTGEDEVRRRSLEAVAPFRAPDGSYRLENQITHVIASKS